MKTKAVKQISCTEIVDEAMAVLKEKIKASRRNAKQLRTLLERLECDPDLSAAEKKQLLAKIHTLFLLSTDELLKSVTTLADKTTSEEINEQVRVVLADEVQKWAV